MSSMRLIRIAHKMESQPITTKNEYTAKIFIDFGYLFLIKSIKIEYTSKSIAGILISKNTGTPPFPSSSSKTF